MVGVPKEREKRSSLVLFTSTSYDVNQGDRDYWFKWQVRENKN